MKFSSLFHIASLIALSTQQEEECYLPIDVVFLQDTTGSFEDDLPLVVEQIPSMVSEILKQNPESYFAVTEFKDKPYYPLGEDSDFCYKAQGVLQPEVSIFQNDYKKLYASGGGDLPEAQFQALINVALDKSIGWRPLSKNAKAGEAGAHLVIMSTDAEPHLPGDIARLYHLFPNTLPAGLPDNTGNIDAGDECVAQDYPAPGQVKAALRSQNIYLAILTPEDPEIVPSWKWVNEDLLDQPAEFYQFIKDDSSDLIYGVLRAIKAVTETACAATLPPTEAPAPTTTTTTTTVPTTTTTTTTTTAPTTTTTTTTTTTPTTTTTTTTTPTTTTTTTPPTTPSTTTTTTPTTTTPTTTTTTTTTTPTTTTTTTTTPTTTTTTTPTTTTTTTTTPTTTTTTTPTTTTPGTTTNQQTSSTSTPLECVTEDCPTTCQTAAVVVKVVDRPKKLHIEYVA